MWLEKSGVKTYERNNSPHIKVRRRERSCYRHWSRDSTVAHGGAHSQATVSLQPMETHRDAEIHMRPVEKTHTGADGCLGGSCDPVGDLQIHGERIPCWTCFRGRICDFVWYPHRCWLCLEDCILWKNDPCCSSL